MSSVQSLPLPQEDICQIINYNCAFKELKKKKKKCKCMHLSVWVCVCAHTQIKVHNKKQIPSYHKFFSLVKRIFTCPASCHFCIWMRLLVISSVSGSCTVLHLKHRTTRSEYATVSSTLPSPSVTAETTKLVHVPHSSNHKSSTTQNDGLYMVQHFV